jgi:transposase
MAKPLVSDALWERIEPLLPRPKPRRFRFPGRKPLDYRKALTGIIFVLKTGIPWEDLPQEMGCGCGMTCLNYLKAWHRAGVWDSLHQVLLQELDDAGRIDWSRGAVDATFVRALGGGEDSGPNPADRSKLGSKHHVLVDAQGLPLNVTTTAANVPEVNEVLDLVDTAPEVVTAEGTRQWLGRLSLGGGTDRVVAAYVPTLAPADGSQWRRSRCLRGVGVFPDLHVVPVTCSLF